MKIISCTNPNTGEYKVEYNGATHLAYANSGYLFNEGEMVYILAPEGDLNAQLRILGKENYY
jgi:hypothetical protein